MKKFILLLRCFCIPFLFIEFVTLALFSTAWVYDRSDTELTASAFFAVLISLIYGGVVWERCIYTFKSKRNKELDHLLYLYENLETNLDISPIIVQRIIDFKKESTFYRNKFPTLVSSILPKTLYDFVDSSFGPKFEDIKEVLSVYQRIGYREYTWENIWGLFETYDKRASEPLRQEISINVTAYLLLLLEKEILTLQSKGSEVLRHLNQDAPSAATSGNLLEEVIAKVYLQIGIPEGPQLIDR